MRVKKLTCFLLFFSLFMSIFIPVSAAPSKGSKFFTKSIVDSKAAASSLISSLDFTPTDALIHPTKSIIYLTDTNRMRLYSVDYNSKAVSYIQLNLKPERLAYLNNELYVTLMITGHQYYTENPSLSKGAIGIINTDTFKEVKRVPIDIDPYDVAVDKAGFIYVTSGSSQWTYIRSYSRSSINYLSQYTTYMGTLLELHPNTNKLYYVTTGLSPVDIGWFSFDTTGNFIASKDSPYHGDYNMAEKFKISPDGKYIFNYAGTIFASSLEEDKDMRYLASLNSGFTDITFDMDLGKFYTASGNKIFAYDYNTFSKTHSIDTTNESKYLFSKGNILVSVSYSNSGSYLVETIDTSAMSGIPTSNSGGIEMYGKVADVIYDSAKNKAYAIDSGLNNLFIINLDKHSIDKTLKLPYKPDGLCLSEDGSKVYIANDDINYLITEVSLSNYAIRNSSYTTEKNCRDFANKKILNKAGKLFITTGEWSPRLLTFSASTLARIFSYQELDCVGGMAVSRYGDYLYTWYQYGWDAGSANSYMTKYKLENNTFIRISEGSNVDFGRDPLKTPIFLMENDGVLLSKGTMFNLDNMEDNISIFPEAIYAMSNSTNLLAGKRGYFRFTETEGLYYTFIPENEYDVKFFANNNLLYILENNTLYHFIPILGDANSDEIVDIRDLASTAKSYNAKKGSTDFSFAKDFNFDNIINLYDLVIVSRRLGA